MFGSLEASRKKFGTTPKRSLTLSSSNWIMQHHPLFFNPDARAPVRANARILILARRAAFGSLGGLLGVNSSTRLLIQNSYSTPLVLSGCAGINRHVVGDERALRERRKRLHLGPESCGRCREVSLEA